MLLSRRRGGLRAARRLVADGLRLAPRPLEHGLRLAPRALDGRLSLPQGGPENLVSMIREELFEAGKRQPAPDLSEVRIDIGRAVAAQRVAKGPQHVAAEVV